MANHLRARPRMLIAAAIGIAAGIAAPLNGLVTRSLLGWNVGVWLYLVLISMTMLKADHQRLRKAALAHAEGAATVLAVVVAASLASLAAIVLELAAAKAAGASHALPQVAATLVTVAGSWLLLPTLFTLNYASLYYDNDDAGSGLHFPGGEADFRPDYVDFLYFSFTIAIALQTADVTITSKPMRRLALWQSLLSFVFNTTILALTINIAAGLF
jgi:uncharacterized membrane protein